MYYKVNSFWRKQYNMTHEEKGVMTGPSMCHLTCKRCLLSCTSLLTQPAGLENVTVISIAGSFRDTLVRSDLASLETIVPGSHGLSLLTTSIPGVRLEADHQARIFSTPPLRSLVPFTHSKQSIMWCNQLVKLIAGAMVDLAAMYRPSGTPSVAERMHLFGRYFIR